MFGIVFSISSAILGLTLLAWGNSIGGEEIVVLTCLNKGSNIELLQTIYQI